MPTLESEISKSSSEKIILALIEPAQRPMVWDLHAGSIYKKKVNFYVINCEEAGVQLTKVNSIGAITAGSWYFDYSTKYLYLRTVGSVDPTSVFIVATYRLGFSNRPVTYPHDLDSGDQIYFEPLIDDVSQFGQVVDHGDQVTVALEGAGNIKLKNNSNEFKAIYDKLFWENKSIKIYLTFPGLELSEKQIIYQGLIESKTYNAESVTFNLKDFISVLRDSIPLPVFDGTEGEFSESYLGKTKRRIYGRVSGLDAIPLDNELDNQQLSGTWTIEAGTSVMTGTGGNLALDEASQNDEILYFDIKGKEQNIKIKSVDSDLQITLVENIEITFISKIFLIKRERPWRKKNRNWQIAGHALREPSTTVVTGVTNTTFTVADITDLEAGDIISINGFSREIRRVSGNEVKLLQSLPFVPSLGQSVLKSPIFFAHYKNPEIKSIELIAERDFSYTNSSTSAEINLENTAEFNLAKASSVVGFLTFTNGSRVINGSGTAFTKEFRPRDWVNAIGTAEWYEVLQIISDQEMHIRTNFSTATLTDIEANKKNPELIYDETKLIIDCAGITFNNMPTGQWVKTASDAVKHLLIEAGLNDDLNTTSFDNANEDNNFLISIKLPEKRLEQPPTYKEVIDNINKSVFGSLHKNKDFEIVYNVLSPDKVTTSPEINDTDILSWDIKTESKNIVKKVITNYKKEDINLDTGEEAVSTLEKTSEIADYLIKTSREFVQDLYLYKESQATIIRNRYSFFKEISESIITIKCKTQFLNKNIGDVLYFKLDRIYDRFGTLADSTKIGIISSIKTNGIDSTIEVDDLAGFYLSVANISPNDAPDFVDATEEDKIKHGYFVNENEIIDPLEYSYRSASRIA